MNEFVFSSIFKELTKVVQLRFDEVTRQHKQLFDNVIFENYLTWDTPQIGLSFEEVIGLYNITIAAATIGDNSKEPIIGSEAPATLNEKVLHHAITRSMTVQTYRKVLQLLDSRMLSDAQRNNELINLMWGDVQSVVGGVQARLDMIFLNALSNEGVATLDADNNPEGGVKGTINYGMPDDNKFKADADWSDENKDTIKVFDDIQKVVNAAQDYVVFDKILIDPAKLQYILATTEVKKMLWGNDRSSSIATVADINSMMRAKDLPIFEPIRRQVRIMDNGTLKTLKPFNAKNLVFVPAGSLGVVKNAYADSELRPEASVAYANYGRIRVAQWNVGEASGSNTTEFTKAEVHALPVFTEINGIYSLNTEPSAEVSPTSAGVQAYSATASAKSSRRSK